MFHAGSDRSRRAEAWNKVAEQGRRLFDQGVWVIMFPEGTRTPRGGQGVYKAGASRLAIAAGVPIVPIAVASARCWPRKSWWRRPRCWWWPHRSTRRLTAAS